jgi:hypothetical protein
MAGAEHGDSVWMNSIRQMEAVLVIARMKTSRDAAPATRRASACDSRASCADRSSDFCDFYFLEQEIMGEIGINFLRGIHEKEMFSLALIFLVVSIVSASGVVIYLKSNLLYGFIFWHSIQLVR